MRNMCLVIAALCAGCGPSGGESFAHLSIVEDGETVEVDVEPGAAWAGDRVDCNALPHRSPYGFWLHVLPEEMAEPGRYDVAEERSSFVLVHGLGEPTSGTLVLTEVDYLSERAVLAGTLEDVVSDWPDNPETPEVDESVFATVEGEFRCIVAP